MLPVISVTGVGVSRPPMASSTPSSDRWVSDHEFTARYFQGFPWLFTDFSAVDIRVLLGPQGSYVPHQLSSYRIHHMCRKKSALGTRFPEEKQQRLSGVTLSRSGAPFRSYSVLVAPVLNGAWFSASPWSPLLCN